MLKNSFAEGNVGAELCREVLERREGEECCREVLQKGVIEEYWRKVSYTSVGEECCRVSRDVLQRSVGDESRGALEMRAGEKCCRKCWGGVLEKVL